MTLKAKILRCACCSTPVASLLDGAITIESRHHGVKHVTVITVASLMEMVRKERRLAALVEAAKK